MASEDHIRGFWALFDNTHAVMLLVEPGTGAIVDANPAACEFYGWTRGELRERTIFGINRLSRGEIEAEMQAAEHRDRKYFRFPHARADGTVAEVEVYSGPVQVDGRRLLLSIIHDVTARVIAEQQVAESEARLRRAEEVARFGHWAFTLGDEEMRASAGARCVYGVEDEWISVAKVQSMALPEYRTMLDAALEALIQRDEPYDVVFQVRRANDGVVVDVRSVAEYDAETRTVFGTVQDVTPRRRPEPEG